MILKYSITAGAIFLAASQSASAITINFDYSYDGGFFSGVNISRQSILNEAGHLLSSRLTDNLAAITSSGINQFAAVFTRPDTGSLTTLSNFNVAADALTVFVGGRALGGSLGLGGPGGYNISGEQNFVNTMPQRGQPGATNTPSATDFAPWGGQISFNSSSNWYFDSTPSTTESFSGNDFYSVALHEISHVLGIGIADSWNNKVSGNNFTGTNSVAAFSGNVPLASDHAHWKEGTQSTVMGVFQEAMMDPTLTTGTRKLPTQLDFAALKDVGWQVTAVPLPSAAWLFGSTLIALAGLRRKPSIKI
jgi:hypothetical protein